MPMQGPQAHSSSRAPEARMSDRAPQLASMVRTCREPGDTDMLTEGATVFPFSMAAAFSMSYREELVQEPTHTWSTLVSFMLRTGTTLSGMWGQAISGSSVSRSMWMTRS